METLFGIPMNNIMVVMLILLVVSLSAVIWVAIRRPVVFRMGMRNIPRRKTQSLLIVFGLMLATLITAASLSVGDTLNRSVGSEVYDLFGEVDQMVVASEGEDEDVNIQTAITGTVPPEAVDVVREQTADLEVDAVGSALVTFGPVINMGESAPDQSNPLAMMEQGTASEPMSGIVGAPQETFDDFNITDVDGNPIDTGQLGSDKVYVTQAMSDDLDIGVGDFMVYVLNNNIYIAEVAGITPNTMLAGSVNAPNWPGMIVGLEHLREATGTTEGWNAVAVSNTGGPREGQDHAEEVMGTLNQRFADSDSNLIAADFKAQFLEEADFLGSMFVTMFIGFGLFSISVGVLLIVLIFTMLAAERRGEMGMARAIGGQRGMLVQQFLSEGAGYTLLSGLVGTTLGVGAAWIIARFTQNMMGDFFTIELYVHPRSLIVAYSLGVIMTFAAVAFSSWRASRLNIVAALRDIPEVSNPRQSKRPLIIAALGIILGGWLIFAGQTNPSLTMFLIGVTMVPFALAMITNWFGVNNKWILTAIGVWVLVIWSMPTDQFNSIFGDMGTGGIELFLLSGIAMVAASTLIILQHLQVLLKLVSALGSRVKGWLGSVKLGVAYPRANAGRSGMTIAMFSLIVFSIVVMASVNNIINQAFMGGNAMAGIDVQVQMFNSNQMDDINTELDERGVNMEGVNGPGRLDEIGPWIDEVQVTTDGDTEWVLSQPFQVADEAWIDLTQIEFGQRAEGYETDEEIRQALANDPNVVIIASSMVRQEGGANTGVMNVPGAVEINETEDGVFEPTTITARGEAGENIELTVIGVMETDYSMFYGYFMGTPTITELNPEGTPVFTTYSFTLDDSRDPADVAADMESALITFGAQGVNVDEMMQEFQAQQNGFMTVLQWFMGLGLVVGVAAVGVISFRSVVERRQQIGVLRSLGFQAKAIGRAFVIETGIIVGLGTLAGVILGLIVSYNLTNDEFMSGGAEAISFQVPWMTLLVTVGLAIGMALLMSWLPARQASRTLPAEALRYE